MLNAKMHNGTSELTNITYQMLGIFSYFCPDCVLQYTTEYVKNFHDTSVNFYEFEKGHGYFIPASQRSFEVFTPSKNGTFNVDADEFGIAVTLYTYDCIIQADISALKPIYQDKAKEQIQKVKQLRDYLYAVAMQDYNCGNLKYIIEA